MRLLGEMSKSAAMVQGLFAAQGASERRCVLWCISSCFCTLRSTLRDHHFCTLHLETILMAVHLNVGRIDIEYCCPLDL